MVFLGFTVAGLRLPSLADLDDIFVRQFPPHFQTEDLNAQYFIDGSNCGHQFGGADRSFNRRGHFLVSSETQDWVQKI